MVVEVRIQRPFRMTCSIINPSQLNIRPDLCEVRLARLVPVWFVFLSKRPSSTEWICSGGKYHYTRDQNPRFGFQLGEEKGHEQYSRGSIV